MKKKLKLNDLKVQSFVTSLSNTEKATVAGGQNSVNPACNTEVNACQQTIAQLCIGSCGFIPQGPQSTCPIFLTEDAECL